MEALIGREHEMAQLADFAASGRAEFVALYGRRRVGKTFLVRSFFKDKFAFYATGIIEGSFEQELEAFNIGLNNYGYDGAPATNWMEAFKALAALLKRKCARRRKRQVVFVDELPCFDTPNSGFVPALDFFWNSCGSWMDNIFFVVCGSATSWMVKNLVYSHGGLHKRLTHDIHLHPFDLYTTERYCKSRSGRWDRLAILQMYTALGGVPYYWSLVDFTKSVAENIDKMFFDDSAKLKLEYHALYRSVYRRPEAYLAVIDMLAQNKQGMTRAELAGALNIIDNGRFGDILSDLVHCDFVRLYNNGTKRVGGIFQLMDFFTLFYHRFGTASTTDNHFWKNHINDPKQNNWYGLAFERVCQFHFRHITQALGVSGIHTEFYAWRSKHSTPAAQIDMIVERADGVVNICEMKYSRLPYELTLAEAAKIQYREQAFLRENPSKTWTQVVLVTTRGLKGGAHDHIAQKVLNLDHLFLDVK